MQKEHCIFFLLRLFTCPPWKFSFVMQFFFCALLLYNCVISEDHLPNAISLENATLQDCKVAEMDSISSVTDRF